MQNDVAGVSLSTTLDDEILEMLLGWYLTTKQCSRSRGHRSCAIWLSHCCLHKYEGVSSSVHPVDVAFSVRAVFRKSIHCVVKPLLFFGTNDVEILYGISL